jgi:protocatechuate 3,4-dioxygenase beta subunit
VGAPVPTDEDGRFTIRWLSPGAHRLLFAAPGFQSETLYAEVPNPRDLVFVVDEEWIDLAGRVVAAADDAPVAGAEVVVSGFRARSSATTNRDGRFRLRAPPQGHLYVEADGYAMWAWPLLDSEIRDAEIRLVPRSRLRGRVVAAEDGRPVAGVPVFADDRETLTDEDGTFAFADVPIGKVSVAVCGNGWVSERITQATENGFDPLALVLRPGERTETVIRVVRSAAIAGRLTDAAGRPVAGAEVEMGPDLSGRAHPRFGNAHPPTSCQYGFPVERRVATAADGTFRIGGLEPGVTYLISAWPPGEMKVAARAVARSDDAPHVELVLPERFRLPVRVVDAESGEPLADVEVWIQRAGSGTTEADGRAVLDPAPAGPVSVFASKVGCTIVERQVWPERGEPAVLEIERGEEEPPGPQESESDREPRRVRIRMLDAMGEPVHTGIAFLHQDRDGRCRTRAGFVYRGSAGHWIVDEETSRFWIDLHYAENRRGELLGGRLHGPFDPDLREVEVRLAAGREISGAVVDPDGRGVRGVWVSAEPVLPDLPEGAIVAAHARTWTDGRGVFRLRGLGRSTYRLALSVPTELLPPAEPVRVEGGAEDIEVRLRHSTTCTFRFADPEGRPVSGVHVHLPGDVSVTSDATGTARVLGLDGSKAVRLVLEAPEGYALWETVVPKWRPKRSVEYELRHDLSVSGTVVDGKGEPASSASVWARREGGEWRLACVTACDGSFCVMGLEPRAVSLVATGPDAWPSDAEPDATRVPAGSQGAVLVLAR